MLPAALVRKQPRLAPDTATIACQCAIFADDAVAGNEDGNSIGTISGNNSARGSG